MDYLTSIRSFFAEKLDTYQSTNVAWDNVAFEPSTPDYLQFQCVQSDVRQIEYGTYGRDERKGFVQVTVLKPNNQGSGPALTKAQEIEALFPRGLSGNMNGTRVLVVKTVIGPAIQTAIHYAIPVIINWHSVTDPVGV